MADEKKYKSKKAYYSSGILYPAGSIISFPADKAPSAESKNFSPVDSSPAPAPVASPAALPPKPAVPPASDKGGKRASDKDT